MVRGRSGGHDDALMKQTFSGGDGDGGMGNVHCKRCCDTLYRSPFLPRAVGSMGT